MLIVACCLLFVCCVLCVVVFELTFNVRCVCFVVVCAFVCDC